MSYALLFQKLKSTALAYRFNLPARLAVGAAAVALILDQASKWFVLTVLDLGSGAVQPILPFMTFRLVQNAGVSYGLLRAENDIGRWALSLFSLIVSMLLLFFAYRSQKKITALALGLVSGGALGNMIDRVRFGAVTDFIDVQALKFPWIFNVGDSAITVGAILILALSFFDEDGKDEVVKPAHPE